MNKDFEEARAEKEAEKTRRREAVRQHTAAWKARGVEKRRNMEQGLREQAGPFTASTVGCVLAEAFETSN